MIFWEKDWQRKFKTMRQGGLKLAQIMTRILSLVKPGVSLLQIDKWVEEEIVKIGGKPSFKMVPGYHWASCINLNHGVVHGVPTKEIIRPGDLVSLDIGLFWRGYHTDMAYTWEIESNTQTRFLSWGKKALRKAIENVQSGKQVWQISQVIAKTLKRGGFYPVREFGGHGIGKALHLAPVIPCVPVRSKEAKSKLCAGMALAIEVIYTQTPTRLVKQPDGWTIVTADGKIAGLFEKSVFILPDQVEVLTPFLWEE